MLWCAKKYVAIIHKENVNLITVFFFQKTIVGGGQSSTAPQVFPANALFNRSIEWCANFEQYFSCSGLILSELKIIKIIAVQL